MKKINVGLIGFGTVGGGVVKCLHENGELIGKRSGVQPIMAKIADLDITTDRGVPVEPGVLTTNVNDVLENPDIDVVIELVGGTTIAKDFVLKALRNGKPVVTANKALLAYHGDEIFAVAKASGADIYYEASVAGGIPIIKALREGLSANHIQSIYGILNGTCNYILTQMEEKGRDFDDVLAEAQALGYAEAEPSLDIDGDDTAHKTTILASLAYGEWFGMKPLSIEGIRGLDLRDVRYAAQAGYKLKLLGIVKLAGQDIEMRVHPTLIPEGSMLASVDDVFNAVFVKGDVVGDTMFYGRGAGRDATASAVVADLVDVGLNLVNESEQRVSAFRPHDSYDKVVPLSSSISRYYLRLEVLDEPKVLGTIAEIIGEAGISIASVRQEEAAEGATSLPIVLITHEAREASMRQAIDKLEALDVVCGKAITIRIEDI